MLYGTEVAVHSEIHTKHTHTHMYVYITGTIHEDLRTLKTVEVKGKVIPLQARCGPEGG
jgi:hypothetical protein